MAKTVAPVVPLLNPKEVSLNEIQLELNQLWQKQTTDSDGDRPAAARASTFSLLVYEPNEAQKLLAKVGFYSGPLDGIFGPRMKIALNEAQAKYGLPKASYATPELIQALKEDPLGRSDTEAQSSSAFSRDKEGSGIADVIASQNPCRVVSLFPVQANNDEISAQVAAYCPVQKKKINNLICCEYITLSGTDPALSNITTLIQSLLINNLPKFLWWKSSPDGQNDLLHKLTASCNAVIFDSSGFSNAIDGLKKMSDLVQQGINIADLNWKRLSAWQELCAEAFDPPSRRDALLDVDRVTIDYEAGNPAQAFLYLGWLASRMQWRPTQIIQEDDMYDIYKVTFVDLNQREIEAELAALPVADTGEVSGDMIDLKLASTNLEADCCTVLCSQTTGCMRMEAGGGAQSCRVQQVTPMVDQKPEMLLSQHLQRWGRDVLFEESLAVTNSILELL